MNVILFEGKKKKKKLFWLSFFSRHILNRSFLQGITDQEVVSTAMCPSPLHMLLPLLYNRVLSFNCLALVT